MMSDCGSFPTPDAKSAKIGENARYDGAPDAIYLYEWNSPSQIELFD
jgi:hypothetical protein